MKYIKTLLLPLLAISFFTSCDESSTSNPATVSRDSFNPPGFAFTTTQDGKIQLHFTTANVEDDFKGFLVFGTTNTAATVTGKITYPNAGDGLDSGVPRCKGNTAAFELFGFKKSANDCEGDDEADDAADESTTDEADADEEEETTDEDAAIQNFLPCEEGVGTPEEAKLSLPVDGNSTSVQTCTLSKIYNGTELVDIVNGTEMTFVVFAVQGDEYKDISWSSNFVEDAASKTLINSDTITLETDNYTTLNFDFSDLANIEGSKSSAGSIGCGSLARCKVYGKNTATAADGYKVYIARDAGSGTHEQRVFVSVGGGGTNQAIEIQARGSQTSNPFDTNATDGISARIPGDAATGSYVSTGITHAAYGNQVFDLKFNVGDDEYFGKLVVHSISYASTDDASDATITVTVILQPGKNIKHYLK